MDGGSSYEEEHTFACKIGAKHKVGSKKGFAHGSFGSFGASHVKIEQQIQNLLTAQSCLDTHKEIKSLNP